MFATAAMTQKYSVLLAWERSELDLRLKHTYALNQVVIVPLPSARQQVWVSWVLRYDYYKRISRVTVGVAHLRTLTARWSWVPSISQNLKPFAGNGDLSISVKPQTNKQANRIVCVSYEYPRYSVKTFGWFVTCKSLRIGILHITLQLTYKNNNTCTIR